MLKAILAGWMLANTGGLEPLEALCMNNKLSRPLGLPATSDVSDAVSLATNKSRSCSTTAVIMPKQIHPTSDDRQDMTRSLREPNNMTELCGVMLSRLAWEMTRVQN